MTRKSKREVESALEDLGAGSQADAFTRQAAAVLRGDRAAITATPPSDNFHSLVASVTKATDVSIAAAAEAVATAEGVEPEPLANFAEVDT